MERDAVTFDTLPLTGGGGARIHADALPASTWGSNVHALAATADPALWERLRRPVCAAAGDRCEACGHAVATSSGRPRLPDCHERWSFTISRRRAVQRLERLVALCPPCHEVQHLGRARVHGRQHAVLATLQRVNRWPESQAVADIARAERRYALIGSLAFDLDLSALTGHLTWPGRPTLYWKASDRAELGTTWLRHAEH